MINISFLLNLNNLKIALAVLVIIFLVDLLGFISFSIYQRRGSQNNFFKKLSPVRKVRVQTAVNVFLCLMVIAINLAIFLPQPKVSSASAKEPSLGTTNVTFDQPLKIEFSRPVSRKSLVYELTPALPGEWSFENGFGDLTTTLVFTPTETPKPDTRYTISLKEIKSYLNGNKENYLFSFLTPPPVQVETVSPDKGSDGILPNQEFEIRLDRKPDNAATFDVSINPEVQTVVEKKDERTLRVKAKDGFKKGTAYKLDVYRTLLTHNYKSNQSKESGEKELVWNGEYRTIEAPGVADYSPKGSGVLTDTKISLTFKQDMDTNGTQSAFSVSPNVAGTFSWEDKRKVTFSPNNPLEKNTKYTVSVDKKALAADGSPLEENISFSFSTIGHVTASFSPGNNASGVTLGTKVNVSFNQAVDHASTESHFAISPSVNGSFSWSGNTLIFNHDSFAYMTRYTVSMASGVKSIYGLDSASVFSSSFTTQTQSVTLNVPSYAQSHMYSCMATAARSALAYKGVSVSENTILSTIGYDSTPFSGSWGDPNAIWGDPNQAVTGNVDGRSGGVSWGYGAHWGPTSRAISNWRPSEVKTGWNVQGIAQEIANGNPVLVWWVNGVWPAYELSWKTPGGQSVRGVNSMHVQVVKGFTGTVDNPTSFMVTDSGYGYPGRTLDVGTFKAKWSWFGNSAVVVR